MHNAWPSPRRREVSSRTRVHAPARPHIDAGDGRLRCRSGTLREQSPEHVTHPHDRFARQLEAHRRQTLIVRSYRESRPVFRFDALELRLDQTLDSTVFTMQVLQPPGQCHPWLLHAAGAIHASNLLRQCFLDELLESPPLPRRNCLGFAKERPRNFECRFQSQQCHPYLWAGQAPCNR